jgi:hypothetical protein
MHAAHAQSMAKSNAVPSFQMEDGGSMQVNSYTGNKKKKKKSGGGDINFQHGLGLTLFAAPSTATDDQDNSAVAYGVTYYPSIRLASISDALSLRLGVSPSLGLSGSVNSREGGSLSFAFELPVDAELHFGNQELEGFGGHVGVGFAFNRIITTDFGDNKALGPHITAGLKVPIGKNVYSLRGSYLLNINSKNDEYGYKGKNVIGLSVLMYFGG